MCHTPKNFLGGDMTSQTMQGYGLQGWFAPNITNDARRGLGGWSVDQIVEYLKSGVNNTSNASGPMSETVHLSTSLLSDEDLRAIAIYLKDQPGDPAASELNATRHVSSATGPASDETSTPAPQSNDRKRLPASASDPPSAADPNIMKVGAQIYADECSGCHTPNGKGVPGLFPSLNGAPTVQQTDPASLLHVVLRGALSVATRRAPTGPEMPSFEWLLSDDQIAAVLTYIRNAWGNSAPPVRASDVAEARHVLAERSD
jgi:mono/diheme cytochrome c family protein